MTKPPEDVPSLSLTDEVGVVIRHDEVPLPPTLLSRLAMACVVKRTMCGFTVQSASAVLMQKDRRSSACPGVDV